MRAMCRAGEDGWHLVVVRLILHYAHVMQVIIPRTFHLVPLIELRPTDEKARGRREIITPAAMALTHHWTASLDQSHLLSTTLCNSSPFHLPVSRLINFRALSVELIATLGKNKRFADGTGRCTHLGATCLIPVAAHLELSKAGDRSLRVCLSYLRRRDSNYGQCEGGQRE